MFEYHTGIVDRPNKNVCCFQRQQVSFNHFLWRSLYDVLVAFSRALEDVRRIRFGHSRTSHSLRNWQVKEHSELIDICDLTCSLQLGAKFWAALHV